MKKNLKFLIVALFFGCLALANLATATETSNLSKDVKIGNTTLKIANSDAQQPNLKQGVLSKMMGKMLADDTDKILLIVLALFIPPVAVGLASDWKDTKALILSIILTLLCGIPGIIYAFIYLNKKGKL